MPGSEPLNFYLRARNTIVLITWICLASSCKFPPSRQKLQSSLTTPPASSSPSPSPSSTPSPPIESESVFGVELPRAYVDTTPPTQSGRLISVAAGGDFQAALNSAAPGDIIELAAGATFRGSFRLPTKNNPQSKWILIRSSAIGNLPQPGRRVQPEHAQWMPALVSINPAPVITADQGSNYYRLSGIELREDGQSSPYGPTLPGGGTGSFSYGLVELGSSGRDTQLSHLPHHIVFERCYFHGSPTSHIKFGLALNGAHQAVVDSTFSDFHGVGQDTQAVRAINGSGPFKIVNNYLEASGENILIGGGDPSITGLVPSDIEIRRNYFFKPLTWKIGDPSYRGIPWSVKNLFETKNVQRLLFEGNILENSWAHAQVGFGIVLKSANQDGACGWCVSQDMTFRYNLMRNTAHGVSFHTLDTYSGGGGIPMRRVHFTHNLLESAGYILFQITGGSSQGPQRGLEISHNTAWENRNLGSYPTAFVIGDNAPVVSGLRIADNLLAPGLDIGSSVRGSGAAWGAPSIAAFATQAEVSGNAFVLPHEGAAAFSGNQYVSRASAGLMNPGGGDFRLSTSSPLRGTSSGGSDPGADDARVRVMISTARFGY